LSSALNANNLMHAQTYCGEPQDKPKRIVPFEKFFSNVEKKDALII
jgi:hypothetical protein